jgi:hypothetical protein
LPAGRRASGLHGLAWKEKSVERYGNLSGNSGVVAYEIGDDHIKVGFRGGRVYTYTYQSAGRGDVEQMKSLARAGQGLSTFISRVVRSRFASKS